MLCRPLNIRNVNKFLASFLLEIIVVLAFFQRVFVVVVMSLAELSNSFTSFCDEMLGNCQHDAEVRREKEARESGEGLNALLFRQAVREV